MSKEIRYAYQVGWGYVVQVRNGSIIDTQERGDSWSGLRTFGTGQMHEKALKEATLHLVSLLKKQYDMEGTPIFDSSLIPVKY